MKRIKSWKLYETERFNYSVDLSEEQIKFLNDCVDGKWYRGKKGEVNIEGSFKWLNHMDWRNTKEKTLLYDGFMGINFGIVKGNFDCSGKMGFKQLISLKGSPRWVDGGFYCRENRIKSLQGCPAHINHAFDCSRNKLTSLKYGPIEVGREYNCSYNRITNLNNLPEELMELNCSSNLIQSLNSLSGHKITTLDVQHNRLTNLLCKGKILPNMFGLDASYNPLETLTGCPEELERATFIDTNITSLIGGPEIIKITYNLFGCRKLKSLRGFPMGGGEWIRAEHGFVTQASIKSVAESISDPINRASYDLAIIRAKGILKVDQEVFENDLINNPDGYDKIIKLIS